VDLSGARGSACRGGFRVVQGVNEHSETVRVLAPVVMKLLTTYDQLRSLDSVRVLPKRLDGSSRFLARRPPSTNIAVSCAEALNFR